MTSYSAHLKSKSEANCSLRRWNTGSCAVACARLARDSDAAVERVVDTLDAGSKPIPNVLTNFLTKLSVCGVIRALDTTREGHRVDKHQGGRSSDTATSITGQIEQLSYD